MRTVLIAGGTALVVAVIVALLAAKGPSGPEGLEGLEALEERVAELEKGGPSTPPAEEPAPRAAPEPTPEEQEAHDVQVLRTIERLGSDDDEVAFKATLELRDLKDRRAAAPLISTLNTHGDYYVRLGAAAALGELKIVSAIPALIKALAYEDMLVRTAAHDALQAITGTNIPFDADSADDEIRAAQAAWREWYEDNRSRLESR